MKNFSSSSCGGAKGLALLRLPYSPLRGCSLSAPRQRPLRAHNLNRRNFSTDSKTLGAA
jgi:hypothetical protein